MIQVNTNRTSKTIIKKGEQDIYDLNKEERDESRKETKDKLLQERKEKKAGKKLTTNDSITKSWQKITEIGGNRDCGCVDLEKWPRFLSNYVSRKLKGSARPKSQNGEMNFNIYSISIFKLHVIFEFYLCIAF
jgi:ribosomal protein L29